MILNLTKSEVVYLSGLLVDQGEKQANSVYAKLGKLTEKYLQLQHCEVCQTGIKAVNNNKNRRYCSSKCRQLAYRRRIAKHQ